MGVRRKARIAAFQGLYAWEDSRGAVDELIRFDWLDKDIGGEARDFASMLIAGTLERVDEIDDHIRGNLKKWSFGRLSKVDLAILRVAVYALIYQGDVPEAGTIDEAVEIAKKFGSPDSFRFVNGVLDGIRRTQLSSCP